MLKIAVTGPESTGKSTLSEDLAHALNTVCVPEFARTYLGNLDHPYTEEDVEAIARGQVLWEEEGKRQSGKYLICDTELIVIKIWMEFKYGSAPEWISERISKQPFDLYLLCDIDIPWSPDPLREHPDKRKYFFTLFHKTLKSQNFTFAVIRGTREQRLKQALDAIRKLEKSNE